MSWSPKALIGAALVLTSVHVANGIFIEYGDYLGTDVMYLDITEDTGDSPVALFGAPDIVGNLLDFDPLSFSSAVPTTAGTAESRIVNGQLSFTIMSNEDAFPISAFLIRESGDYTLTGLGNAQATASVTATAQFTIRQVNGLAVTPVSGSRLMQFVPDGANGGGDFALPADQGTAMPWSGDLFIDVVEFAAANIPSWSYGDAVTKVDFVFDNTLTVTAANGGSALIAIKEFHGVNILTPEPNALMLLGLGVLVPLGMRRAA